MKKLFNKKGFTLAELLIVVAIIAVLVAIAIPVFSGAVNRAHAAKDIANVRSIVAEQTVTQMTTDGWNGEVTIKISDLQKACDTASHISVDKTSKLVTVTVGSATQTYQIDPDVTVVD